MIGVQGPGILYEDLKALYAVGDEAKKLAALEKNKDGE